MNYFVSGDVVFFLFSRDDIGIVAGGVLSGIGKGVTASSIGVLCKMMGLRPTAIKIDPYLNVDAGTMSPFEHGEVGDEMMIRGRP